MCMFNCFSTICWKDLIHPPNYSYTLLKNQLVLCVDLFMDSLFCFIDLFFILMPILYHTLLVTIALWWVLKSDGVRPLITVCFFWKTFFSHQKTKLECMWGILVLVLCLVRDLEESPKTIVLHPRHLCLVLTAVLGASLKPLSPNQSESSCPGDPLKPWVQSVWIKWSCLVARAGVSAQGKRWSLWHSDPREAHDSPGHECPECSVLACDELTQ